MAERGAGARWLGVGILVGLLLFFLCYWWIGSLTLSVTVGLAAVALAGLATRFLPVRGRSGVV